MEYLYRPVQVKRSLPLPMSTVGCEKVYLMACYCGQKKLVNYGNYFEKFCIELRELLDVGFEHSDTLYVVSVLTLPCDAPARADIPNIYHHSVRKPCHKYKIISRRYMNRQVFLSVDDDVRTAAECSSPKRTDSTITDPAHSII